MTQNSYFLQIVEKKPACLVAPATAARPKTPDTRLRTKLAVEDAGGTGEKMSEGRGMMDEVKGYQGIR